MASEDAVYGKQTQLTLIADNIVNTKTGQKLPGKIGLSGFERSVILAVVLESICAEVMTLPFVLYTFCQVSFVSLPANMLVVALIPLGMLLSTIAGMAGMLLLPIAGWFAWPAKILLTYMLDTAQILAHFPHVFVQNMWLSLCRLLLLYDTTLIMIMLLGYKDRRKSDTITDRNIYDSS